MLLLSTLLVPCHADDLVRPIEPGAFTFTRADAAGEVLAIGLAQNNGSGEALPCPLVVSLVGGVVVAEPGARCPPALVEAVRDAGTRWSVHLAKPPELDRVLLEVWYLFPAQGAASLFVRQAHDQTLLLRDLQPVDGGVVEPLPWGISGRRFPKFPEEALTGDTRQTTCEVRLEIGLNGTVSDLEVSRCDDIFIEPTRAALAQWRFAPPVIAGESNRSAVTFAVQYARNVHDDGGPPGLVQVHMPPEVQGRDEVNEVPMDIRGEVAWSPPPPPTGDPLFTVNHRSFAKVHVFGITWPEVPPADQERSCEVLFGVNTAGRVWAWPEVCDPDLVDVVEDFGSRASLWAGEIAPGERYARFRATFVFPAGGKPPFLQIPGADIEDAKTLPERVFTFDRPKNMRSVPPKVTNAHAEPAECVVRAQVRTNGKPENVVASGCPDAHAAAAVRAVKKWRWLAATENGASVEAPVAVKIRFGPAPKTAPEGPEGASPSSVQPAAGKP